MAKIARERALRERRELKLEKKAARKAGLDAPAAPDGRGDPVDGSPPEPAGSAPVGPDVDDLQAPGTGDVE
jgi:hypothetical protein